MSMDYAALLPEVSRLAEQAGEAILKVYESEFAITHKEDRTPLTEADLAAHHLIEAGLQQLTPDVPVLSEESAKIPFSERSQWSTYWLVDPLDGTREFIDRNGEFTVNIALIENHQATLGVIQVPVSGVLYTGALKLGAWRQSPGHEAVAIRAREIEGPHIVVAGSRSHGSSRVKDFLEQVGDYELFPMGSSLKSCLIAEGKADLYPRFGPTSEWDTAAAQAIVEAAGGFVTDTQMQPLRYNTKDSLLNPEFFVFGATWRDWAAYLNT
jgi:3'(2'), 5'-bisphosphate nucleotidase